MLHAGDVLVNFKRMDQERLQLVRIDMLKKQNVMKCFEIHICSRVNVGHPFHFHFGPDFVITVSALINYNIWQKDLSSSKLKETVGLINLIIYYHQ